ncbi:MAG TPA: sigma-70 family RNA polymerase sigma factor [Candidatus Aphodocola excrementigallinarum]|uniref:Sigma-70 family RNA polymerase sigma factor n=1 Tax=Candidatus Aphodocola excrementigallinarum TaxID=2840670 RepID=A0A9D1INS6_9FIRM|nr:sigma-70 family RNA polymerase sigma factor [Candidatus Aphodocola excrementigallinarum]
MKNKKDYRDFLDDGELLYMISDNNEEASEAIYKKYEPVISYFAKKYSSYTDGKGIDYNDLYQEGLIGLMQAIDKFKDQKDIKFSTFAFLCIKRKIISLVRDVNRKKHSALNDSYSIDYKQEDDTRSFDNILTTNYNGIEELLVNKEKDEYFNKRISEDLSSFEKTVYDLRLNNFSYEEISHILNKTPKSIDGALARIKLKIKNILDEIN